MATKAGTTDGLGDGIATDNRGNSYLTGFFFGRSTFGAGEDNETVLTATGSRPDIFVAKYDRNGRLLWATKAGGTDDDTGQGIATDNRGNSYVSGLFLGTAIFGAGEDNETELSGSGGVGQFALFVAKYDRNGLLLWAKGGGSDSDFSGGDTGIATDGRGNSYVTGGFSGTATLGTDEAEETVLEAAGDFDVFVAKYRP